MDVLVVDASVIVDLLARFDPEPIEALVLAPRAVLAAPALIDIEALSAFRKLERLGAFPAGRAEGIVEAYRQVRIGRYEVHSLLDRIWRSRRRLTAYDATYVGLAEILGAPLVTRDRKLANAAADRVEVRVP
ncbi:MAG: type II toxin-antitoxin system VapC family toxin [Pseudomonadota bacterium]